MICRNCSRDEEELKIGGLCEVCENLFYSVEQLYLTLCDEEEMELGKAMTAIHNITSMLREDIADQAVADPNNCKCWKCVAVMGKKKKKEVK
jgi:hypothetical protein